MSLRFPDVSVEIIEDHGAPFEIVGVVSNDRGRRTSRQEVNLALPEPGALKLSIWQRIMVSARRFEDSPAGDIFGIAVLFAVLFAILCIGGW